MEHIQKGLFGDSYASRYPECDAFCRKARDSIFESLCLLNRLPRSDPFWASTNLRPAIFKLDDFCSLILKTNSQDRLALWTMAALDISRGGDDFGYKQWMVLKGMADFDVTWPISAALLQGGNAGVSATTLAALLLDMDAVEAAWPILQKHADSAHPNKRDWARRVLNKIQEFSER